MINPFDDDLLIFHVGHHQVKRISFPNTYFYDQMTTKTNSPSHHAPCTLCLALISVAANARNWDE